MSSYKTGKRHRKSRNKSRRRRYKGGQLPSVSLSESPQTNDVAFTNTQPTPQEAEEQNEPLTDFKKEITAMFFELLLMIKLYHWNTYSFASHKATDELYESLNGHTDRFIEVLLGKTTENGRIAFNTSTPIDLVKLDEPAELRLKLDTYKDFLANLNTNPGMQATGDDNADLFTIRDEILADINKFLYLLTLH